MFEKLVIGVDGGPGGREALTLATVLAPAARLLAVHVYSYERYPGRASSAAYEQVLREDARVLVERELAASAVEATVMVTGDLSPAAGIDRVARRERADLIVLGSSHRGPVGRLLAGDSALAAIHGAHCAVAVAPRRYAGRPPGELRVLAAFDGTPEAQAALAVAGRLAAEAPGRLRALCVVEPPVAFGFGGAYGFDWTEVAGRRREECRAALAEALDGSGPPATSEVAIGLPAQLLADASRDADLLVAGSRAHGALRRLLLGSTSLRLLRTAACPVLLLPRGALGAAAAPEPLLERIPA